MNSKIKKFLILLLIIGLAPIIGGLYGILNDQLTYTISPEYYTKFKFYQFGLIDLVNNTNPRMGVSVVGFLATWWVGLPIGIILGFVGLIHKNSKQMFYVSLKAIFVTIIVAFITGLIGLAYGKFYLANTGVNWWLPDSLIDTKNFIAVGSMHNFSYLGGLTGVIAGVIYSIVQRRKYTATDIEEKTQAVL
jgi:LytS/YehU family sensor histidine kinase